MRTRPATPSPASGPRPTNDLDRRDVDGSRALRALLSVVGNPGALSEGAEAVASDAGEVNEEVLAGLVRGDEPEALVVAEPLHGAGRHVIYLHGVGAANAVDATRETNCGRALLNPGLCDPVERATR